MKDSIAFSENTNQSLSFNQLQEYELALSSTMFVFLSGLFLDDLEVIYF